MAAPEPAMMLPRELVQETIALKTKPTAKLHYTFAQGKDFTSKTPVLVICLNGLMSDKSTWLPMMAGMIRKQPAGFPSLLAYDRYGQGLSEDRDPQDQGREPGRGHDVADVVDDLHQLITQIVDSRLHTTMDSLRLVLVANSIGCAIARLYTQSYPGTVTGLLLLDSMMANSNFDWWPNPDAADFDAAELSADVTIEVLQEQRAKFARIFAPSSPNKEGLNRSNLPDLLPHSDRPLLQGPGGRKPLLTVIEHDPERFALESLQVGSKQFAEIWTVLAD
ncbi:MAG: hypothetical protein Q9174_005493 [Haloplaca sp. 1 TL-2023]